MREKILKWVNPLVRIPIAGMDISDLSVKYVKLAQGNERIFDVWGETSVPEGLIQDGEVKDEEKLRSFFASFARREGRRLTSSFLAISLPEEKSFLRLIQIPKVKREDAANAIRWEIEENVPLKLEELYYDYEIAPEREESDHLDVVLTAFPREAVDAYVRALTGAGLRLAALELESRAIARASARDLEGERARLVADLGHLRTGIAIFAGSSLIFTTTVKIGGGVFEKNIAEGLGVSMDAARDIKKKVGLDPRAEGGKIFSAYAPALSALVTEFKRALEYYRDHASHSHGMSPVVEEALLLGGDANLDGLDTYLSSALKIPVRKIYPYAAISTGDSRIIPPIPKNQLLAFTIAIGLALYDSK